MPHVLLGCNLRLDRLRGIKDWGAASEALIATMHEMSLSDPAGSRLDPHRSSYSISSALGQAGDKCGSETVPNGVADLMPSPTPTIAPEVEQGVAISRKSASWLVWF
jgi:hypothetical protein